MLLKVQIASVSISSGSMPITNDLYWQVQYSGGAELNLDYMVEGQGGAPFLYPNLTPSSWQASFATEVKLMLHYYAQVLTFIEM